MLSRESVMGKKKAVAPAQIVEGDDKTESVRIPAKLAKIAVMLSVHENKPVAEILGPILDEPLRKRFGEVWSEVGSEMGLPSSR